MAAERKIKLVMVAPANNPHTQRFAEYFVNGRYDLKIVSYSQGEIDGAEVYVHSQISEEIQGLKRKWEYFKDYAEVRKILEWADIVFVNYIYNWRFNHVYRGLKNIVVLLWGSDIMVQENETSEQVKYKRMILATAKRVLAFSGFLAIEAEKYMPDGQSPEVLKVGVRLDRFHPVPKTYLPDTPIVIGYAKGLSPKYGPEVLIKACDYLRNEGLNFRCRIAGGGKLEVQLKIMVDRLNLKDYVEFIGWLPHDSVPDFMHEIDIFVMPSVVQESFGVAALEASASGLPVVASDIGGIPDVVWNDETGMLVEPNNPEELAMALKALIMSPDLRSCMGRQGRDFVKSNFNWENTVKQLDKVFNEVLGLDDT